MNFSRKAVSLILLLLIVLGATPLLNAPAAAAHINTTAAHGRDYTTSPLLASKLDDIFDGTAALVFSDGACTNPVNTALGNAAVPAGSTRYVPYKRTGRSMSGESCFIYASGVYNYLFGDYPGWDGMRPNSVECTDYSTLTYAVCQKLNVPCGAYVRAATHSFIVLAYDEDGLTLLNANYNTGSMHSGTVSILTLTWGEVSSNPAFGQGLEHIVLPEEDYYASLYPQKWNDPRNAPVFTLNNAYGGVQVAWSPLSGATGYTVYRKVPGDTEWTKLKTYNARVRGCLDPTPQSDRFYLYTVRANRGKKLSGYSAQPIHYLAAPDLKSVSNTANRGMQLKWTAVYGATYYVVYRKTTGTSDWKQLATVRGTAYIDVGAIGGKNYQYTVAAGNRSGESGAKNTVSASACLDAPHISAIRNTSRGIVMTWDIVKGADNYNVYRKTESSGWLLIGTTGGRAFFTDTSAKEGVAYTYTIRAFNADGIGGFRAGVNIRRSNPTV